MKVVVSPVEALNLTKIDPLLKFNAKCSVWLGNSQDVRFTKEIENTNSPKWDQTFTFLVDSIESLNVNLNANIYDGETLFSTFSIPLTKIAIGFLSDEWYEMTPVNPEDQGPQLRLTVHIYHLPPEEGGRSYSVESSANNTMNEEEIKKIGEEHLNGEDDQQNENASDKIQSNDNNELPENSGEKLENEEGEDENNEQNENQDENETENTANADDEKEGQNGNENQNAEEEEEDRAEIEGDDVNDAPNTIDDIPKSPKSPRSPGKVFENTSKEDKMRTKILNMNKVDSSIDYDSLAEDAASRARAIYNAFYRRAAKVLIANHKQLKPESVHEETEDVNISFDVVLDSDGEAAPEPEHEEEEEIVEKVIQE